jgi:hypothetical protein
MMLFPILIWLTWYFCLWQFMMWCGRGPFKVHCNFFSWWLLYITGHMVLMNMFLVTWQGTYWGEGGWFRLIRGVDSLNIEEFCSWAVPKDAGKCWSAHGSQKCWLLKYTHMISLDCPGYRICRFFSTVSEPASSYLHCSKYCITLR